MAAEFVHLHLHTEYSLLDGLTKIKKLTTRIKELEMDTVAITDHGAMYGAIEFYKKCKEDGVKPIIGMEAYTCLIDHTLRDERAKKERFHLLLLAKDEQGYKNLMKIASIANTEGFYYKPRISNEILKKYSKGLICTSACPAGELASHLIDDDYKGAKQTAEWFLDVFGKDYYLEVQRHNADKHIHSGLPQEIQKSMQELVSYEKKINEGVVKLSREFGIPIVATNDAHYLNKEDATAQDVLVCVATGVNVSDTKRIRFIDTPEFYVKSPTEMKELFPDLPDAISNTVKLGEKCDLTIALDKWFFPTYILPKGKSAEQLLSERSWEGVEARFGENLTEEVKKRLEYELDIINQKGYATYFLTVSDMTKWASENGIMTNTRGSAAGSLVSYCVGIININPLTYGLTFERFLTPWRPTPPDIDLDIADDKRDQVISYLVHKFGDDKVAQICTFGRMLARASARDVARVLGYPYAVGDKIAKLIPPPKQGFPIDIPKALKDSPELKALYDSDADVKKVLDLASEVEGSARHVSIHAAGVVIAPTKLEDFVPIFEEDNKKITQYDMEALDPNVSPQAIGLLKFDLLGLRNLSILGSAMAIIKEKSNVVVSLDNIPLDDKKTYEMLSRGETMGVFQMASSGMTKWIKELKPERVEDLMAMVALYRPGPMQFIPEYIARKQQPEKVTYIDPRMKDYMDKSYGLMIYQEDVLLTAINIAGYSWEDSDKFRKAVGKKIPEEMAKQHDKFVSGCEKNGLAKVKAEELFAMIEKFAAYGFNKAHSASYGMVAYWTAYMKANFPIEYMCALLTAESGDTETITQAISECRRMGISILSPDINESEVGFTIVERKDSLEGRAIRFGFSAIKNVGKAAIEAILEVREEAKFSNIQDFFARVDGRRVNKKVLESLVKVGALSAYGSRAAVLASLDELRSRAKPKSAKLSGQQDLFGDMFEEEAKTAPIGIPQLPDLEEFSQDELESLERQLLGFSLSAKPISEVLNNIKLHSTHTIYEIVSPDSYVRGNVKIACVVSSMRVVMTKNSGAEMAFLKFEDETGTIEAVVFPQLFKLSKNVLVDRKSLLVSGKVETREDTPSLIVESIVTPADLDAAEGTFKIKIPSEASVLTLSNLKKLLLMHPGQQKVTLLFEKDKNQAIDLPFGVTWDQGLSRSVSELLYETGTIEQ